MVLLGAIESIKAGTTVAMEVAEGIMDYADELQKSGLRLVLAEQISDRMSGSYGEPGEIKSEPCVVLFPFSINSINSFSVKYLASDTSFGFNFITTSFGGWQIIM